MRFIFAISFFLLCANYASKAKDGPGNSAKPYSKQTLYAGCPMINNSGIINTPSDCNGSDGSITGVSATGTGTLKFTWYDAEEDIVSKVADMTGVAPGKYKLEVTDQSKCTPTIAYYTVGQADPVDIDDSKVNITPSGCSNNGAISNLQIQNGDQYQWQDAYGNTVGTTLNLTNVASGFYTLTASNASGCSSAATYQVTSSVTVPQVTRIDTAAGVCNSTIGTLTLTVVTNPAAGVFNYNVFDASGQQAYYGNSPVTGSLAYTATPQKIIFDVGAANANYSLVVTNSDDCTITVGQYSLPVTPYEILTNGPFFLVRNDACGRHTGGVFNIAVTQPRRPPGGNPPAESFTWTDSLGNVVSQVPDLTNVGKGVYTIVVKDINGCEASAQFTIRDSTAEAYPPVLSSTNVTLCLPGTVNITVSNPNPKYKYRLYDSTQTAITENDYGIFQIKATQTASYTVTTVDNQCESSGTPLKITVIAPGVIIPNTFTPNNDGINDHWDIPHIDDFPGADVAVYNRDGQLVFHSINYGRSFDGTYNGKQLPGGVYYYTIDLKQPECFGKISGSLTLVR